MLDGVLKRRGLQRSELAIVGDRLYTDMRMAKSAGVFGILVLSGETKREQLQSSPDAPDLVVADVGELAEVLCAARR
jgi:NagD protein